MFRGVAGRVVIFCAFALANSAQAQAQAQAQGHQPVNLEARAIFQQLIEINTTDSVGNVSTAAEAMAQRLLAAGFPEKDVIVAGPDERKKNLVARLRGTGQRKPILFIGHLDVVEAHREDWSMDPF
jgi:acetylornithine deacetylase/succinyl-diaminopimelate desuccinylase-like protein